VAGYIPTMQRTELLNLYFLDARAKLIELAAFIDRINRAKGDGDHRLVAFMNALDVVAHAKIAAQESSSSPCEASLTEKVLFAFSDPTVEPAESAEAKSATGAWPGVVSGTSES
jgi:hypothetical protein